MAEAAAPRSRQASAGGNEPQDRPATARSHTSEAVAETYLEKALVSHREHRITIPMPKTLDELRGVAQRRFRNGRGLYHHGRRHLSHQNHVAGMRHDDVVVVGLGTEEDQEAPLTSTQRSHFVRHEVAPRPSSKPEPGPGEPAKWYGESRYGADFGPHKAQPRQRGIRPPDGLKVGRGSTGPSTYRAQFSWVETAKPDRRTNHETHTTPGAFESLSSYQADFKPQTSRPRSLMTPRERLVGGGEFHGCSTYGAHFQHQPGERTTPLPGGDATVTFGDGKFDGSSEYAHRYVKHPHELPEFLHLEPQKHHND